MRKQEAAGRYRLEATGSPSTIDKEIADGRSTQDRRAIGNDVDDTCPVAHQSQLSKDRKHLDRGGYYFLNRRKIAALGIRVIQVKHTSHDQLTLLSLIDINTRSGRD